MRCCAGLLLKTEAFPKGQLQPYITAGPGIFIARGTNLVTGPGLGGPTSRGSDTDAEIGVKAGAGLAWQFHRNLALVAEYRFTHFRKTVGYANHPLDGIWARAPYLHNGAVPTLRDLLESPEARPARFYRGYDVFDAQRVGFVHDIGEDNGTRLFAFDTALPGNGNDGHRYGIDLPAADKDAIVEYLKTF